MMVGAFDCCNGLLDGGASLWRNVARACGEGVTSTPLRFTKLHSAEHGKKYVERTGLSSRS
jgi:hypothetical protein